MKAKKHKKDVNKIIRENKTIVYKLFKDGHSLGRICRETLLDVGTVLLILRKSKIDKKKLYVIYENQSDRNPQCVPDLLLENEQYYIDKFFPSAISTYFSTSYVAYWKQKLTKIDNERNKCKHKIRNITCASCGKILADASNIPINTDQIL